jgi:transcriptional regulator with XRE-family HTH domain
MKEGVDRGKLGSLIYGQRLAQGWGLRKAGQEWGIAFTTLSRLERGQTPSAETLSRIVGILALDSAQVAELFLEDDE